jgi:hypothetical protein
MFQQHLSYIIEIYLNEQKWLERVGVWKGLGNSRMITKVEGPESKHLASKGPLTHNHNLFACGLLSLLCLWDKKGRMSIDEYIFIKYNGRRTWGWL